MESPPFNIGQDDEDRISALPDHLLVGILERLDLQTAIRAGVVSTRWRHLPHQLTRLRFKARHFQGTMVDQIMGAYTDAVSKLLCTPACGHGNCSRAIKTLRLSFYFSDPQMSSIGRAVEEVVSRGETKSLKFSIVPPPNFPLLASKFGEQFMSFSRAYPVAFRSLTMVTLKSLTFGDSDISDLIRACDKLKRLSLKSCKLAENAVLKIDTPCSGLRSLKFTSFRCTRIELISVPKLRKVWCYSWRLEYPPVLFGNVPCMLREVRLSSYATASQAPFALSEWLSRSVGNLSRLSLSFGCQMVWIKPEHPRQLTAILSNLTDVQLCGIFPECDLTWTLFILEAASHVTRFTVSRTRHPCVKRPEDIAEKTNVKWEPSKDFKHFNLKLLVMRGFEEEESVINYLRLVMERVVGLKRIKLYGNTCEGCNAIDHESTRSQVDEASRHRVRDRITNGAGCLVEIIIC